MSCKSALSPCIPAQGQLALPADVQAKLKAAQQMAAKLGMQHLPQQTSQPTTQDTMRLIATAQAIASNIAQQVGCHAVQSNTTLQLSTASLLQSAVSTCCHQLLTVMCLQHGLSGASAAVNPGAPWMGPISGEMGAHFESELEINDFPQHARWKACPCPAAAAKHMLGGQVTSKPVRRWHMQSAMPFPAQQQYRGAALP